MGLSLTICKKLRIVFSKWETVLCTDPGHYYYCYYCCCFPIHFRGIIAGKMFISYQSCDELSILCTVHSQFRCVQGQAWSRSLHSSSNCICWWWFGTPSNHSGLDHCKLNKRLNESSLFVFALLSKCGMLTWTD